MNFLVIFINMIYIYIEQNFYLEYILIFFTHVERNILKHVNNIFIFLHKRRITRI